MAVHGAVAAFILRFVFPRASATRRRGLVKGWSRKLIRIVNVTPRVEGAPPREGERDTMIVANHVSWLDIFVLSSVHSTRFIAKSEIRDWPFVGWVVEKSGTLFIKRGGRVQLAQIAERTREALAQGDCIGLFPEGTTTEGDQLLKFHSALFESAAADGARVFPVAIRYEHPDGTLCREASFAGEITFMQSFARIVRQRSVVARVSFGEPIDAAGLPRRDLAQAAQSRIATLLGLAPAGKVPRKASGPRAESP
jgi:1-acyl-sn-glycerol-3-phosphate acyltransferase